MDISGLNTRAAADLGADMTLRDPVTGADMGDTNGPATVIVRGTEGRAAQEALKAARQRRLNKGKPEAEAEDSRTLEEFHDQLVEAAVPLIVGFRNIAADGRALTAADAEQFLNFNMISFDEDEKGLSFVEQVLSFAGKRKSFLPKPVTGQASMSGSSAGSTPSAKA